MSGTNCVIRLWLVCGCFLLFSLFVAACYGDEFNDFPTTSLYLPRSVLPGLPRFGVGHTVSRPVLYLSIALFSISVLSAVAAEIVASCVAFRMQTKGGSPKQTYESLLIPVKCALRISASLVVICGWIAIIVQFARREVAILHARNSDSVHLSHADSTPSSLLSSTLGPSYISLWRGPDMLGLQIDGKVSLAEIQEVLLRLPEKLAIRHIHIMGDDPLWALDNIQDMNRAESIYLVGDRLSATIKRIPVMFPRLKDITIQSNVGRFDLLAIANCRNLHSLSILNTTIDRDMAEIINQLGNVEVISLEGCILEGIAEDGFAANVEIIP